MRFPLRLHRNSDLDRSFLYQHDPRKLSDLPSNNIPMGLFSPERVMQQPDPSMIRSVLLERCQTQISVKIRINLARLVAFRLLSGRVTNGFRYQASAVKSKGRNPWNQWKPVNLSEREFRETGPKSSSMGKDVDIESALSEDWNWHKFWCYDGDIAIGNYVRIPRS